VKYCVPREISYLKSIDCPYVILSSFYLWHHLSIYLLYVKIRRNTLEKIDTLVEEGKKHLELGEKLFIQ
jgi:hypothetical protein